VDAVLRAAALGALLLAALNAGIFYAWSFTVMNGLDAADPAVAIAAMQSMNESIRNGPFALAFFGAPVAAALLALALSILRRPGRLAAWAGLAGLAATAAITVTQHVPWNQELAALPPDLAAEKAAAVWAGFSDRWTPMNHVRALTSTAAVAMLAVAFAGQSRRRSA
jgi:uncharacterized membrane protein